MNSAAAASASLRPCRSAAPPSGDGLREAEAAAPLEPTLTYILTTYTTSTQKPETPWNFNNGWDIPSRIPIFLRGFGRFLSLGNQTIGQQTCLSRRSNSYGAD